MAKFVIVKIRDLQLGDVVSGLQADKRLDTLRGMRVIEHRQHSPLEGGSLKFQAQDDPVRQEAFKYGSCMSSNPIQVQRG